MIIYYDHKWDSIILFSSSSGGGRQQNNHHLSFPSTHQRKPLHPRTANHCFWVRRAARRSPTRRRTLPSQFTAWTSWTLLSRSLSCSGLLLPSSLCILFSCLEKPDLKSPQLPSSINFQFHPHRCCCTGLQTWYRILDRNPGWYWSSDWLDFHLLYGFPSRQDIFPMRDSKHTKFSGRFPT